MCDDTMLCKRARVLIIKSWGSPLSEIEAVICGCSLFQHVASDPPTAKSLSQLVVQLLQFQEDNFGKDADKPPRTRLPVSLYSGGVLHQFLSLMEIDFL